MQFLLFVRKNARWLAGAFLIFLFSAVGQTYFISLSAGDIRSEYALSHGEFGSLYMAATLLSALTLTLVGQFLDRCSAMRLVMVIVPMLVLAAISMALSQHIIVLFLAIYLLRFLGQGMMIDIAFTVIARWFSTQRGRAVSLASLGMSAGEALFPIAFVTLSAAVGWRTTWWLAAGVLWCVALPLIILLITVERTPQHPDSSTHVATPRDWTRAEVLRDPFFYLALLAMIPPPLIGNTIFFHQVYLVALRGWSLEIFAASFSLNALTTVAFALVAGHMVDRFTAMKVLPFYLLPLGLGCFVLSGIEAQWAAFAFMALYGLSNCFSLPLFGSLWPEIYGLKNLRTIRAAVVPVLIIGSAVGPGVTGLLIGSGVSYPAQVAAMGAYCWIMSIVFRPVMRRLHGRRQVTERAIAA